MNGNPFTISFGKEPAQLISRIPFLEDIIETFNSDDPSYNTCILTGVRGSGKTVALTEITGCFTENKGWIVVQLNPQTDMIKSLTSKLCNHPQVHKYLLEAKVSISVPGIEISFENSRPVTDISTALETVLKSIKKKNRKVLITIDEVSNNSYMKAFANEFQIMSRNNYPLFLLMTGIYKNISNLQNDKALTFLYRAPKKYMPSLKINAVKEKYRSVFGFSEEQALEFARITKGYPYAFQMLGYILWNADDKSRDAILPSLDEALEEYVYEKIWNELSVMDKKLMAIICRQDRIKVQEVREEAGISSGQMSVYRNRLKKNGLVDTSEYGHLSVILPRFDVFVRAYT